MIKQLKMQLKPRITVIKKKSLAEQTETVSSTISQSSDPSCCKLQRIPSRLPDTIEPTDIFHSKYEILNKIGEGANGIVFKCIHKRTEKHYAVKKLSFEI